jgi:hypothetical protein
VAKTNSGKSQTNAAELTVSRLQVNFSFLFTPQIRELVDAMHEKRVPKGSYVIREGTKQNNSKDTENTFY